MQTHAIQDIPLSSFSFEKYTDGLIPTIVQDVRSGKILMLGFSNADSIVKTQETGFATFFSRSHQRLWTKGETSENTLLIKKIRWDCDMDTLLFFCIPTGPTCHTGAESCFFAGDGETDAEILWSLFETVLKRKSGEGPENSYVKSLFAEGLDRIAQKVGEEAIETVIAAKNNDKEEFVGEVSDLLFHILVLLAEKNISLADIAEKLKKRRK